MTECFRCHTPKDLHIHEVFYGVDRQKSIDNGCYVALCEKHHNMSNDGVHFNPRYDYWLKKETQLAFERKRSHEESIRITIENEWGWHYKVYNLWKPNNKEEFNADNTFWQTVWNWSK